MREKEGREQYCHGTVEKVAETAPMLLSKEYVGVPPTYETSHREQGHTRHDVFIEVNYDFCFFSLGKDTLCSCIVLFHFNLVKKLKLS